jgi:Tfp pilus assembly protein PilV
MTRRARTQRGISLIEALVAMAIMAFGMLGILGLQAAIRGNSDISKQRSEAVRYAQERTEQLRTFSVLDTTSGAHSYFGIASEADAAVSINNYTSSANFSRQVIVTQFPPAAPTDFDRYYIAAHKNVVTKVSWTDRNGDPQWVQLNSIISKTAPEIMGALSVAAVGSAVQMPSSRNINIPVTAVDLNDGTGTSRFSPPGAAAGVSWIFDNQTALITKICTSVSDCSAANSQLLAGYVRFALGSHQPQPAAAESPPTPDTMPFSVGVIVATTSPAVRTINCFTDATMPGFVAYFCSVPVTASISKWSGRSKVTLNGYTSGGSLFASNITDDNEHLYRVCRYTSTRTQAAISNEGHPLDYVDVTGTMINQNFLVIRAGDDHTAFDCPDDDPATPVFGRTWHHQPAA